MGILRKTLDVAIGAPIRHLTYHAARAILHRKYIFELDVEPRVYALQHGAIICAKHAHRDDGPLLVVLAWPWARLRPLVYHREYKHPLQWPFMITVGAVPGGDGTTHRGKKPGEIITSLLDHGWGVLIFPGGRVAHDGRTEVPPRAATVHQALADNPGKPLIMVRTEGLGRDEPQRRDPVSGRQIVRVIVRQFDPDLTCDVATFNARLASHLNTGEPMPPGARRE